VIAATTLALDGRRLAEGLPGLFAQKLGIVFTGLVELNELAGDRSVDTIVAIAGPQNDADQFEGQAQEEELVSVGLIVLLVQGDTHLPHRILK
jgi:hypothetical protein